MHFNLNILYCLIASLMLGSCSAKRTDVGNASGQQEGLPLIDLAEGIGLNSQDLLLSDASSSIRIIPLETNESCVISSIKNVFLAGEDIIIQDAGFRLLRFDAQGHFLNSIGSRGQGPGEYTFIFNTFIDASKKLVYAVTTLNGIYVYDFNGRFLKSYPDFVPDNIFTQSQCSFYLSGDDLFIEQHGQLMRKTESQKGLWSLATVDSLYNFDKLFFNPAHKGFENEISALTVSGLDVNNWNENAPSVNIYGTDLFLKYPDVDTVYQYNINEEIFTPLYSLNLGKYKGDDYLAQNMWYKERSVFDNLYITSVLFADKYMYLIGNKGEYVYEFQYDRSDGTLSMNKRPQQIETPSPALPKFHTMSREFVLKNDISGGQFLVNFTDGNNWIFEASAESIRKGYLKDLQEEEVKDSNSRDKMVVLMDSLDDDSNPILIVAGLK